ncbi:MAG TPA: Hsp20/alpha crystallin family protein [Sphingomicrobium sp.]|jgi:HSP20 family protein|nr:Hsp20/alpha crystallin family protein [Sphingomicrobium sp.]
MAFRDLIPFTRETNPSVWREEWAPVSFRREMDRLFDDFFRTPTAGSFGTTSMMANWPSIDVKDKDNELLVTAEVPGLTDKDVELFVDNGMLTIRGEKKREHEEKGYSERFFGRFERQIPLPSGVDEAHCKADFRDGLLTIHLPKTREAEQARKKIPINAETRH